MDEYLLSDEYKKILHAHIGAKYVKEKYNLDDDIVKAIDVHTVAAPDMDILAKILFVADKIEPNKDYIGIEEERRLAYINIDKALKFSISVACLTIPVLLCFGKELGMLFYKSKPQKKIWKL